MRDFGLELGKEGPDSAVDSYSALQYYHFTHDVRHFKMKLILSTSSVLNCEFNAKNHLKGSVTNFPHIHLHSKGVE